MLGLKVIHVKGDTGVRQIYIHYSLHIIEMQNYLIQYIWSYFEFTSRVQPKYIHIVSEDSRCLWNIFITWDSFENKELSENILKGIYSHVKIFSVNCESLQYMFKWFIKIFLNDYGYILRGG